MAVLRRWVGVVAIAAAGCPAVAVRPDGSPAEEKCPDGAREALESFGIRPGASVGLFLEFGKHAAGPIVLYDGPIESETWGPMEDLPDGVRLFGRVWTGGPRAVIRYYAAQPPGGARIPFCAVASWNGPGLPRSPGRPGSAAVDGNASVTVVGQFR